ncbi:Sugar transport protein 14 [Trifolium repens]|nr:sugar transport protein [Trifolium repens]WJX64771.1 Sugar transport protein 14 [Trifolium repens]
MAGGALSNPVGRRSNLYEHNTNIYYKLTCTLGAIGGALFGYDLGVSGGVTSMDDFLEKFFPEVYMRKHMHHNDQFETDGYCKYDDQLLTLFTSSLYFSAILMSLFASHLTKKKGRRASIIVGALTFLLGAILNVVAVNIPMLIIGRILLGAGIGFGNQAVPIYLSEMAPAESRGKVSQMFQLATCLGILAANLVNFFTVNAHPNGWRVSLGLAGLPAIIMLFGGVFILYETPTSLVEQGKLEEARRVLEKIRGTRNVDAELDDIIEANQISQTVNSQTFKTLLMRKYRPQLWIGAIAIPAFQQLTGVNCILFYAPVIFESLGFGTKASLISSFLTNGALLIATLISMYLVDKYGRRKFFIEAGMEMVACMIIIGLILAIDFGHGKDLSRGSGMILIIAIFVYVFAFGRSWGPLGWLVPSELFNMEIKSAAQSIVVSVNMSFTALVAQLFLLSLCHLKYGVFFLFGGFLLIMTCFIYFLLPETKKVPIEEVPGLFKKHTYWKRYMES